MHVIRGRPEIAERHGAGHVARCTRPCASWVTWVCAALDAPGPRAPRAARRESSARPTSSKGISTRSDRTSCGSPTFPHCVGGTPSYARTFSGWVYVASVTDVYSRRIIGWQNHLPASVHRPGPRRPGDGRLATKTSGGRPDGPGASLATAACSTGLLASGQALAECEAVASVGSKGDSFRLCSGRGAQAPCTRPSSSFGQGPWQDIDAAEGVRLFV